MSNHLIEGRTIRGGETLMPGEILIPSEQIQTRLKEMAPQIAERHAGRNTLILGILKGAMLVTSDLGQYLYDAGLKDTTLDFMRVESYGNGTESTGQLTIKQDIMEDITGRDVLAVEDIADTNHTLNFINRYLLGRGAASVSIFALLEKKSRHVVPFQPDYVGFQIGNIFVQGYGLDYKQMTRLNRNIFVGPVEPNGR